MIMKKNKTDSQSILSESLSTRISNESHAKNTPHKADAPGSSRRAFVAGIATLAAVPILSPFTAAGRESVSDPGAPIDRIAARSRQEIARAMKRSAAAVRILVETAGMSMVSREGAVGVATTIAGLELMPATQLIRGIDTGYIYLSGASNLPPGYYLLRVTTLTGNLGENVGVIELFDRVGTLVLREATVVNIDSLTLPERPPGLVPTTTIGIIHTDSFVPPFPPSPCAFEICFLCSNGYGVICLRIPIATCFIFMP